MNFKTLRIRTGLTQNELSSAIGVAQNTVSNWENGERMPSAAMLPKIAQALNCTIDELFADTDEIKEAKTNE